MADREGILARILVPFSSRQLVKHIDSFIDITSETMRKRIIRTVE